MTCREEVVALTCALIAVDTSNPPGRETAAARVLARYLADAGVECELVGPDPERLNLVARLRGAGRGPSLLLLGHTDVVPAPPAGWTTPPFEPAVRDGLLFGRGAADMKGELAARAVALATIARAGDVPDGDVVLIAEADEEDNVADVGMSWLARERPELRCDFALNEGGGQLLELDGGGRVVTIAVGEKQVTALRIRVFGEGGHASMPTRTDNAVLDAARAIERLLAYEAPCTLLPAVRRALAALGAGDRDDDEAVAWARGRHPMLARMLPAMTRMTVTPTGIETDGPANVIPRHVDLTCDCRPLPGQTAADVRAHVARALGDGIRFELELLAPPVGGTESPVDTPLYSACERYVAERLPGAVLLPVLCTGFTDSHFARAAHRTVAYGFAPVFATDQDTYLRGVHNVDETLAVADLVEMVRFHVHAIRTLGREAARRAGRSAVDEPRRGSQAEPRRSGGSYASASRASVSAPSSRPKSRRATS